MTSLLSAISGRFSSSVVLGTFFPVLVFAIFFRVLVIAPLPDDLSLAWAVPLQALDERWEVLAILLASVVATGLLHNLNTPLIRLYEGYPWQTTWFGRRRRRHHQRIVEALETQQSRVALLLSLLQTYKPAPGSPEVERLRSWMKDLEGAFNRILLKLFHDYPEKEFVLPTRLGNVIRSFERHSSRLYVIDAIAMWPRLQAVMKKEHADMLGEAKAGFDFMLNSATLSILLALTMLAEILALPDRAAAPSPLMAALARVGVAALVARWLYLQAIEHARGWGAMVRSAFDLYRWDLLKQMGYTETPRTPAEERALWSDISTRLVFGPLDWYAPLPYATDAAAPVPTPPAVATPPLPLSVLRGVERPNGDGFLPVRLLVTNDSPDTAAERVTVLESLPPGYDYAWGSAEVDAGRLSVTGADPLRFEVRHGLRPGRSITLTYRLARRPGTPGRDAASPN